MKKAVVIIGTVVGTLTSLGLAAVIFKKEKINTHQKETMDEILYELKIKTEIDKENIELMNKIDKVIKTNREIVENIDIPLKNRAELLNMRSNLSLFGMDELIASKPFSEDKKKELDVLIEELETRTNEILNESKASD